MNVSRQLIDEMSQTLRARLHLASLYSSPAFAAIWNVKSGRPTGWVVQEAERTLAVLPGVEFGRGPLTRFQAMPDGLPSSVFLADPTVDRETIGQALLNGIFSHGYAKVFVTDYLKTLTQSAEFDSVACETAHVSISSDWTPPDKTLQSEIRKAEREGVTIVPFSTDEHLDDFLALLRKTEKRLNISPRYPDEFYAALAGIARHDSRVAWKVVAANDRLAAAHVYLLDGATALYWISCFDKEFSYLKATQYLLFTQGRTFAAQGKTHLNLGQTPPEAGSLEGFKMKWGAESYHYRQYQSRTLLGRLR